MLFSSYSTQTQIKAAVAEKEMLEHAFYQGLNLAQAIFLHTSGLFPEPQGDSTGDKNVYVLSNTNLGCRLALCAAVTSPWILRSRFPINRFSDNYTKPGTESGSTIAIMYRVKKYQYIFYKHALLHGLNVSVAVYGISIGSLPFFRLYWICLNTAYVVEFFMQSLVKRKLLDQGKMLMMNMFLMAVSTMAALPVLQCVCVPAALASLALKFSNRNHELANTMLASLVAMAVVAYT